MKAGYTEDEVYLHQIIEKFIIENDYEPNFTELSKVTKWSPEKLKRVMESLERKKMIKVEKDGSSKRVKLLKYLIPTFAGATGTFLGFKIISDRQNKKQISELNKDKSIMQKIRLGEEPTESLSPTNIITTPERSQEIVYVPTKDGGYKASPVNILYQPAPIDLGDKEVNVYGGGSGGEDLDEYFKQLIAVIGDNNCVQQNISRAESGFWTYQKLYQFCVQKGGSVTIEDETELGSFLKFSCRLQNCFWEDETDTCDCTRDKNGNPKSGGGEDFSPEEGSPAKTMTDVLTGKYKYDPQDEEPVEGYDPFGKWQKEHAKDSQPEVDTTESVTPSSPRFSPLGSISPSGGGKTPCASHSTEAECIAAGCTYFSWMNTCG